MSAADDAAARGRRDRALRPMARPRLYEQLVARLCEFIEDAGLSTGDKLPPERDLAQRLGVSRASVTQALVALEVQGIVDVRHGEGAVLLEPRPGPDVVEVLGARRALLPEVLEAREALEVKLAELAAARRTDDDLAALDDALSAMAADLSAGGRGEDGDERFHLAVTTAAHSGLLADLKRGIAGAVRESRVESLAQPGRPPRSLADHRRIADAIRAGDGAAAADAMRRHIRHVADVALLRDDG